MGVINRVSSSRTCGRPMKDRKVEPRRAEDISALGRNGRSRRGSLREGSEENRVKGRRR